MLVEMNEIQMEEVDGGGTLGDVVKTIEDVATNSKVGRALGVVGAIQTAVSIRNATVDLFTTGPLATPKANPSDAQLAQTVAQGYLQTKGTNQNDSYSVYVGNGIYVR